MLNIEKLTVEYHRQAVIRELSYSFAEGKITAITGTSGIGKTTLLNVIAGLKKPTYGKVERSFRKPGYIFQDPRLFPWMTALENVSTVCGDVEKAKYFLDRLLPDPDAKDKFPQELSGGMKQRVSIARALAYEPDILFLDEPFKGLDPETRAQTTKLLFDSVQGKTVLMVTHDEADTAYCDVVLRMEGTPASRLVLEKSSKRDLE